MATNDITLYIPPTEEEVMLIQPNNVTFGQYSVTEWQENLLTLISDQIQQHMTREKQLPKDLFNQPVVEIKCDEAGGKNNKSKVLKEAIAMMRKNFSFRWVHPNIHQTVETFGVVITTVHNIKGTNRVALTLNPWAIPFLLYYGTGVGGTRYGKNIALTPPGQLHQAALQDHLQPTGQTGVLLLDRAILQRPGDPGLLLERTDRPKGFKACTDTNQGKRGRCMVRLQIHLQNA